MVWSIVQPSCSGPWELAALQHGVIARRQLLAFGLSSRSIEHRVASGRLHRASWGIYAVGRPHLTLHGRWMAAILSCGAEAVLSHASAAALWKIRLHTGGAIHVSVPGHLRRSHSGIVVHRRQALKTDELTIHHSIPVTSPICTLIDLAAGIDRDRLEAAINEADKLDLVDPEQLRRALDRLPRRPGLGVLRQTLDRRTFTMTDSELERRFLPIARSAGLPNPETRLRLNGFKVDFYWPDLGLVVETDGLRYHRTAAQQARDRLRDQVHAAAGLTPLRFTHGQVRYEASHVGATLTAIAGRLRARPARHP
jgi:very-short-patch-repair endonuclease